MMWRRKNVRSVSTSFWEPAAAFEESVEGSYVLNLFMLRVTYFLNLYFVSNKIIKLKINSFRLCNVHVDKLKEKRLYIKVFLPNMLLNLKNYDEKKMIL